ncbi:hypothetical protein G6045_19115 [Streptomyces sp. YC504]|uniref:Uncharacterized protein n=1 Tax=Streptomyces mesophilus TaxID=1775132 RepID=A0A6G4XM26_9ACTN|nr:hypothetical protein [Streptomyces mesophilus]NGO77754.1 hypothetical protein [Streptomyces mesophilus]
MTAVAVEIRPRPTEDAPEPEALIVVEDIEALTTGAMPGCSDDNPYR